MIPGEKSPMPISMIFGKINHLDNKQPAGITPAGFVFSTPFPKPMVLASKNIGFRLQNHRF